MVMFILLLVLVSLTIIGWYVTRDVFSPFFVQPGIWAGVVALYLIISPNYWEISMHFPISLMLFSTAFLLGGLPSYYYTQNQPSIILSDKPNQTVLTVFRWISILAIPSMLFIVVRMALDKDPEHLLLFIRMVNTGYSDDPEAHIDFGIVSYAVPIPYILLLYSLVYDRSKKLIILSVFLNLLVGLLSMSKTSFLSIIFAIIYLLHRQNKIKPKAILWTLVIFFVLMMLMQFFRSSDADQETFGLTQIISQYFLASIPAYDGFSIPCSAEHYGENCFRFIYAVLHSLGNDIEPIHTLNEFVEVPQPTNVFTILHPFNKDFGYVGLFVFGLLYGFLYGFLYKKNQGGHIFYTFLYVIFLNYLILEFFAEYILLNLSLTIQYIILAALPFLINGKGLSTPTDVLWKK